MALDVRVELTNAFTQHSQALVPTELNRNMKIWRHHPTIAVGSQNGCSVPPETFRI